MNDFIKRHWDEQSLRYGGTHQVSWDDRRMISLEIETIGMYIKDGDSVLDIGCANGFSTILQSERHKLNSIIGIDYSENMIECARKVKVEKQLERIDFHVGDIRKIDFPDNSFDVVYTTRVLINLPNWEEQKVALAECLRVVKNGGKVIISEAFWEPLVSLNAIRSLKGLKPLEEHDFNLYLKKAKLEEYLGSKNIPFEVVDFSSIYYLGSRFLRELLGYQGFENKLNEEFYNLERIFSGGGFGIQVAYAITKPA